MTPARFDGLETITSLRTTGVAAVTPGRSRTRLRTSSYPSHGAALSSSIVMWAWFPRIFRLRSWLNPPITLTTLDSAHDESETPQIERMLMTVRNPLFGDRTWRAPTNDENVRPSSR